MRLNLATVLVFQLFKRTETFLKKISAIISKYNLYFLTKNSSEAFRPTMNNR